MVLSFLLWETKNIIWNFARKSHPHKETIKQKSKRLSKKIGVYFLLKKGRR